MTEKRRAPEAGDVLLCGACDAGRPADCSGWCGVAFINDDGGAREEANRWKLVRDWASRQIVCSESEVIDRAGLSGKQ